MTHDALVVGGGPAGCAAAIDIARSGRSVVLVERREQSADHDANHWGALLSRPARQLLHRYDDGFDIHEISQLRVSNGDRSALRPLDDGRLGVVARTVLDDALIDIARRAGVEVLSGHEATRPIVDRGFLRGAEVSGPIVNGPLDAEYVIIADGANSTFGRSLGTYRRRNLPHLICARGTWSSPLSRVVECEIIIGLRRSSGDRLPGHIVVTPDGHGSVTLAVTIPSMAGDSAAVNAVTILDEAARTVSSRWAIDPDRPLGELRTTRLPVGRSVRPIAGPTFLVVGDAAASADPLTALGLGPALIGGQLAGACVAEAISTGASAPLQAFPDGLERALRRHHRWAQLSLQVAGRELGSRALSGAVRLLASTGR